MNSLIEQLDVLLANAQTQIKQATDLTVLESLEVEYLGRKGRLAELMKQMAAADPAERPRIGQKANEVKVMLEEAVSLTKRTLSQASMEGVFAEEQIDITEPGEKPAQGHLHLVTQAIQEISAIFERIGFVRTRYPEVEWDWYVFESLNMDKDHPARDDWETFFLNAPEHARWGKMLLTTQATSGTARHLAEKKFPMRAINIQKTYRRQIDITHVPMFHQFDGVYVDKGVNLTHLLGMIEFFVKSFFGKNRHFRLRPYHFRFTEPSFEIDISCAVCEGKGTIDGVKCRTCKRGWLELGGAGMLHPNVLKAAGINSKEYSGIAFGWGVERTYLMKEGLQIDDIRHLYKNDLRFLQQF